MRDMQAMLFTEATAEPLLVFLWVSAQDEVREAYAIYHMFI